MPCFFPLPVRARRRFVSFAGILLLCSLGSTTYGESPVSREADGKALMKRSDCLACHAVQRQVIGPAFVEVARRYRKDPKAETTLIRKIKTGGSGVWGAIPMAGHPGLSQAELRAMVRWILSQK
jgi:cytochrome c